jgi:cytochrome P450
MSFKAPVSEWLRSRDPASSASRELPSVQQVSPGLEVEGFFVPAGTIVSANVYTMSRSPLYWADPSSFEPERWFDNGPGSKYENDNRSASKPFLLGPRSCLGKQMALSTLRLVLAHLAFRYDFEMVNKEFVWERDVDMGVSFENYHRVLVHIKTWQRKQNVCT